MLHPKSGCHLPSGGIVKCSTYIIKNNYLFLKIHNLFYVFAITAIQTQLLVLDRQNISLIKLPKKYFKDNHKNMYIVYRCECKQDPETC